MDSLPRARARILSTASATVVTLTPPPVDPGEAPIHINVTIIISVGVATKLMFTLSNPADRAELARKKAVIQSPTGEVSLARVCCWTIRYYETVAATNTTALHSRIKRVLKVKARGLWIKGLRNSSAYTSCLAFCRRKV